MDYGFGASINVVKALAVMISMLLGMGYPSTPEELGKSSFWRAFYLCPVPFTALALFMILYVHTSDSLLYHVQRNEKEEALKMIKEMYILPAKSESKAGEITHEKIYDHMRGIEEEAQRP